MIYYNLVVKADMNDADYITKITKISSEELEKFRPIFKAIKEYSGDYNWPTFDHHRNPTKTYKGKVSEELIEEFEEEGYIPYGENGVHTIVSVELFPFVEMIEKII